MNLYIPKGGRRIKANRGKYRKRVRGEKKHRIVQGEKMGTAKMEEEKKKGRQRTDEGRTSRGQSIVSC